ncbi:MAG: SUMF1/EgtB/PvdO family nonheme iron enzyme [Planctomycetaceae bacterium]|nr:SUMF1/EgtB/PvdO family nonheme iron enzyme [Planctomycetaceae bacterium]
MNERPEKPVEENVKSPVIFRGDDLMSGAAETYISPNIDTDAVKPAFSVGPEPTALVPYPALSSGADVMLSDLSLPNELRIVCKLDRGGMGEVFLVERDTGMGLERLALKTLLPEQIDNAAAIARFQNEVRTLKELRHDCIVPLRDFRKYDRHYFFIMEYIEGVTLYRHVEEYGMLNLESFFSLFEPLADAVDYSHRKKILHRDIKPSNIMLGLNGNPYLLDFGIAQNSHAESQARRRIGAGTWEYMAPEQFDDEATIHSDVYGLGATMYFALVGRAPFSASGIRKLLIQKEKGCSALRGEGVPLAMAEALRQSMLADPHKRPSSCSALVSSMLMAAKTSTAAFAQKPVLHAEEVADVNQGIAKKPRPTETSPVRPQEKLLPPVALPPEPPAKPKSTDGAAKAPLGVVKTFLPLSFTNSIGMKFRLIEAGTFLMGSPVSEECRGGNEVQHPVTLTQRYYMGSYPVTRAEYREVMGNHPSLNTMDQYPVEEVSWEEAQEFIHRLNVMPAEVSAGRCYRLPTEAEWEYACRAGTKTAYSFGDDASLLHQYGWFSENSLGKSHPVGVKRPNAWGLYDMHGNVWEWCHDWYGEYPSSAVVDPKGPSEGACHVLRGGRWGIRALLCRAAKRHANSASIRLGCGFRLALSPIGSL